MSTPTKRTIESVTPGAPKKAPKELEFDDGYTYTELNTFAPVTFDGVECGVNARGDVVNEKSGAFVGHFDYATKTLDRTAPEPKWWLDISCINDLAD